MRGSSGTWLIGALVALLVALGASPAWAAKYVPPPIAGHVTDKAGKLTPSEISALNDKLANYRKCSSNHVAVFYPSSLEGNSIEDVAYVTFNTWKVGEGGKDNGVLLVLAPNERKIRIETGKGVGGELTDLETSHILRDVVGPNMKADRFFAAADQATTSIATKLGGCPVTDVSSSAAPPDPNAPVLLSPEQSLGYRIPFTLGAAAFIALACLAQRNRGWAALLGLGTLVGLFLLLTYPARSGGLDSKGYLIVIGAIANVIAFVMCLMWGHLRRSIDGGTMGAHGGSASSSVYDYSSTSSSSDYSSSSGSSDYSGGGGSSGGGGASDSY